MKEKRKSSTKNFVIAALIIFLGIALSIGMFIYMLTGINDNSYKFIAPSESQVYLEEGNYTIFYEYRSEFEGVLYTTSDQDVQGLGLIIIDEETNKLIDINLPNGASTYNINGNSAYAIYTFELEKDSELSIQTITNNNRKLVLNINGGMAKTIMIAVFILLFGISASIVVGLILILLTVAKISKRNKEELALEIAEEAKLRENLNEAQINALETVGEPLEEPIEVKVVANELDEAEDESVRKMWSDYIQLNNLTEAKLTYESWSFGLDETMARELADLVLKGKKQGTASLHKLLEIDNEELSKVGDLNIITDWNGKAECIIVTTDVTIKPFNEVDETFARTEGEGDGSLYFWKKAHIDFFTEELKDYDFGFSEDLLVVCETFKVVYK